MKPFLSRAGLWLWILSQVLAFAPLTLAVVANPETSAQRCWEMNWLCAHVHNVGCDAGLQSGLNYDAEFPSITMAGLCDSVGLERTASLYDLDLASTIRLAGSARALPHVSSGFLAANTGVNIARPGGGTIYGEIAGVGKIHGVSYGETLWIENIAVNQGARLQGNSIRLYEALLKEAPATRVIRGEAGGVNLEVLQRTGNINLTPRARALNQLGFTQHEYDAVE